MNVANRRNLHDALSEVTKALPAAAAANTTNGIYLGGEGPHREGMKLKIVLPANSVLVADKTITFTLHDSADNSSFAAVSPGQSYVITGTTGFAATTFYFDIPANARAYVAVNQAVLTAGGDNTGTTTTVSLVC